MYGLLGESHRRCQLVGPRTLSTARFTVTKVAEKGHLLLELLVTFLLLLLELALLLRVQQIQVTQLIKICLILH